MVEQISMEALAPVLSEVLSEGESFPLYPRGISMLPLIREGEDAVILVAPTDLKVGDILLYRRKSGQYVLHRLIKLRGDACVMCGDNQVHLEYGITTSDLIAKVSMIQKPSRTIRMTDRDYLRYVHRRMRSRPFRHILQGGIRRIRRLFRNSK